MSFKFTLVLLAIAIVVVAGFGIAQSRVPSTNPSAAPAATPTPVLLDLSPPDVNAVALKSGDKETSLVKDGANWKLAKPTDDATLDQAKVTQLIGRVATLNGSRTIAPPNADLGPYGLRSPQLTVALSGTGGKKETLLVGDKNVNGNQDYAVRQEGSDVGLIPSQLVTALMDLLNNPPKASPSSSAAPSAAASGAG